VHVLRGIEDFWFGTATLPDNFRIPHSPGSNGAAIG